MKTMTANVSSDDLRAIAITSAIAAAGTALATSLVEIALTKYVLKSDQPASTEPTFVVVPVVERSTPPLPAAGLGALRQARLQRQAGPMSRKGRKSALSIAMRTAMPGFGADAAARDQLIAETRTHPRCYDNLFSYCLDDDKRYKPECRQFEHWHQLYDVDKAAWDAEIDAIKFCDYDKRDMATGVLVGAAIGAAIGAAAYALGSR